MWRHPKYYKELRKLRNKEARVNDHSASISDQAISESSRDGESERATGPGPKQQAVDLKINLKRVRKQYTSDKHQATSCNVTKPQASSGKHQAPSSKHQASSRKRQAHES